MVSNPANSVLDFHHKYVSLSGTPDIQRIRACMKEQRREAKNLGHKSVEQDIRIDQIVFARLCKRWGFT